MDNEFNADAMSDEEIKAVLGEDDTPSSDEEEQTDTETETADDADADKGDDDSADTETGTVDDPPALNPLQQQFQDLGLGGQFTDVSDVLKNVGAFNRHIDNIEKQNADHQRQNAELQARLKILEAAKVEASSEELRERFEENPLDAMRQAGFVKGDDVQAINDKLSIIEERQQVESMATAASMYPELKDLAVAIRLNRNPIPGVSPVWDEMRQIGKQFPNLSRLPFDEVLGILYEPAKARVAAKKRAAVPRVSTKTKAGANTNAGNAAERKASDEPDYNKMTDDQIWDDYAKRGMVGR
jgi:hypothetical protein